MDLDLAQRISLIQRNLSTAQVMIDSAVELLNIIIAGASVGESPAPTVAPKRKHIKTRVQSKDAVESTEPEQSKRPTKAKPGRGGQTELIRQYMTSHSGEFTVQDVLKWAQAKGHVVDAKKMRDSLYQIAHTGRGVTAVGQGVYQRAA